MYTIKLMNPSEHTDTSWEALFSCEDEDRRNYKLMYSDRVLDTELTFSEAKELKAYYEQEDALAADFETEYSA